MAILLGCRFLTGGVEFLFYETLECSVYLPRVLSRCQATKKNILIRRELSLKYARDYPGLVRNAQAGFWKQIHPSVRYVTLLLLVGLIRGMPVKHIGRLRKAFLAIESCITSLQFISVSLNSSWLDGLNCWKRKCMRPSRREIPSQTYVEANSCFS